jgi:uncharacterized protein
MTKILVLADIHGHADLAEAAVARNSDAECIFIAGDLTNFGSEESARHVIKALRADGRTRAILMVAGNCDNDSVRKYIETEGLNVEGRVLDFPFGRLVGAGGGLKRAGITCFERTEKQLAEALSRQLAAAAEKALKPLPLVVLTHTPPYGTNADQRGDWHVGSKAFAALMIEYLPKVWICGHIHESRSISLEDGTLVVNPGPCGAGFYAVLEIGADAAGEFRVRAELSR